MPFSVVSGARMPTATSAARQASSTTTCGRVTTREAESSGARAARSDEARIGQLGAERPQHGVAHVPLGRDHPGDADRAGVRAHVGLQLGRRPLGRRDHERVVLAHQRHPRRRRRGRRGRCRARLDQCGVEHVPREVDVRDAPGVGQRPVDVEPVHVAAGDEDLAEASGRSLLLVQRAVEVLGRQRTLRRRGCRRAAAAASAVRAARAGRSPGRGRGRAPSGPRARRREYRQARASHSYRPPSARS